MPARIQSGALEGARNGSVWSPNGAPTEAQETEWIEVLHEDFEDDTFEQGIRMDQAGLTTNALLPGKTRCARMNLREAADVTDPYLLPGYPAGAVDNAATVKFEGDQISSIPADQLLGERWTFRFRYDDAHWLGSNTGVWTNSFPNQGAEPDSIILSAKMGFHGPSGSPTAFYVGFTGGDDEISLNFGDNNSGFGDWWSDPANAAWSQNTSLWWNKCAVTAGADGQWHTFELEQNFEHPDYNQVRLLMDGVVATGNKTDPDGWMRIPKNIRLENHSTTYTNEDIVNLATDRTGVACGVQVDHIRIYKRVSS